MLCKSCLNNKIKLKNQTNKEELNLIDLDNPRNNKNVELDFFLDGDDNIKDERISLLSDPFQNKKIQLNQHSIPMIPEKQKEPQVTRQIYESKPASDDVQNARMWHVAYYRGFFDLTTELFIKRLKLALWPFTNESFFSDSVSYDLYGPFWITTTLIVAITILSGLLEKFNAALNPDIEFQFHTANIANFTATVVFFLMVVPVGLRFGVSYYTGQRTEYFKMLSLYGYSMTVFVPMCVLYLLPLELFRYFIVLGAAFVSGFFIRKEIIHMFSEPHHVKVVTLGLIGIQLLFALIFKFYFIV